MSRIPQIPFLASVFSQREYPAFSPALGGKSNPSNCAMAEEQSQDVLDVSENLVTARCLPIITTMPLSDTGAPSLILYPDADHTSFPQCTDVPISCCVSAHPKSLTMLYWHKLAYLVAQFTPTILLSGTIGLDIERSLTGIDRVLPSQACRVLT